MSVLKKLNPNAKNTNTLKLHGKFSGCCGSDSNICKFELTQNPLQNVTGIVLNQTDKLGNVTQKTVTFAGVTTTKEIRKSIAKALEDNGYDPYYPDDYKSINIQGSNVAIIGDVDLASLIVDGNTVNFVKKCKVVKVCNIKSMVDYDTQLTFVSGGNTSSDTGAGGVAAGNPATLKTHIEADMTALGISFVKVVVTEDVIAGSYVFNIHTTDCPVLYANGNLVEQCAAYQEFSA